MEDASTIDNFLWPNKYLLEIVGLWPRMPGDHTIISRLFVHFRIVFATINFANYLVPEVLKIIVFWGDLSVLTGIGCIALTNFQLFFKLFYVLAYRRSFRKMYLSARELWSMTADKGPERQSLDMVAGWAKRFTITFFLLCFSNNISFTTVAVLIWINQSFEKNESLQKRILPFDHWYGVDFQPSPTYEIIFSIQTLAAFYCCIGVAGLDSTIMSLILHVCGHFRVLVARFRAIGDRMRKDEAYSKSDSLEASVSAVKDIGRVVERHTRMLIIAEDIRVLLSPVIFVQLLTSSLTICLSGYAVMAGGSGDIDTIKSTCFLLTMFLQLGVWCWPGQLLIDDSTAVGDVACYEMPWHLLTPGQQRDVAFLILRTQKECQITALGFQVMSMSKITEVFNTAGSYFALLRKIFEKQMEEQ